MTDHQYKVGDEVWIRVVVDEVFDEPLDVANRRRFRVDSPDKTWTVGVPRIDDVRTDADFKDSLDEAIVEASPKALVDLEVSFGLRSNDAADLLYNSDAVRRWRNAVQTKLDADKPKTPQDIHLAHYDLDGEGRCTCGEIVVHLGESRPEKHTEHIADKLRAADLLREGSES